MPKGNSKETIKNLLEKIGVNLRDIKPGDYFVEPSLNHAFVARQASEVMPPAEFVPKPECSESDEKGHWEPGYFHDGVVYFCYRVSPSLVEEHARLKKFKPGQRVDFYPGDYQGPQFLLMSKEKIDKLYDEMEKEAQDEIHK